MAHPLSCLSNFIVPNLSVTKPKPSMFKISASSEFQDVKMDKNNDYKVDRRKMILGLGASNLLLSESVKAELGPLQPPNLDKCHLATITSSDEQVPCCPPTNEPQLFTLPANPPMKTRRSAHKLAEEDLAKYKKAISRMKQLSVTDPDDPRGFTQQANVHCAYCNYGYDQATNNGNTGPEIQVHGSWTFFPFHRWYLYFYERILGSLIDDPTFALPFWNWDNPMGMTTPPIFMDPDSPLYNTIRNQEHMKTVVVLAGSSDQVPSAVYKSNCSELNTELITGSSCAFQFMGSPFCEGNDPVTQTQAGLLENGSHNAIHGWVGDPDQPHNEDMGNFYSAGRDPIFYCHHTNVDRMWTIWQTLPAPYEKTIKNKNFLDASFVFYDENAKLQRVKVGDCLDNRKMGFKYEEEDISCWRDYKPPKQTASAKRTRQRKTAAAPKVENVLPLKLEKAVTVVVKKVKTGKANETLVLYIDLDSTKFASFDVFVNDEDDSSDSADKAAFAGSFTHIPRKGTSDKIFKTFARFSLTSLYDGMDVEGDETILVTLVPRRSRGDQAATIAGIKLVEEACEKDQCPAPAPV